MCCIHEQMCVFIAVSESQKGRLIRTYDLFRVEIKIDSMVNDGPRPWIVISVISRALNGTLRSVLWITPNSCAWTNTSKAPEPKHRASHQGVGVESLGVSHEIEEGIRKIRERLIPERPAEEEDSRKGPEEGRRCASLVQGSGRT